jgi:hypothetical protein
VAAKTASATKSVIVTNKAVAARSASARNRAVVANREVAAKSAAAKKAADDKLRKETARALVIVPWINERREATLAVFQCHRRRSARINAGHRKPNLISVTAMNRSIFYIIGVIVVIVIVLKLLGLF